MSDREILITVKDRERLEELLEVAREFHFRYRGDLQKLADELQRSRTMDPSEMPATVVTMNSRVKLVDVDTGEEMEYTLVFPNEAGIDAGRLSVLSPVGTAILGYRVDDVIEWEVPGGRRRIRIVSVPYQPEAAGHRDL
ncbi:MAG TPA: nucleoside diphosphate kinase regulator [Kiritimatiellia bacterium]|nr:nucleoside diphosphate kinase regulator [Kiritimatiellia bacterium]